MQSCILNSWHKSLRIWYPAFQILTSVVQNSLCFYAINHQVELFSRTVYFLYILSLKLKRTLFHRFMFLPAWLDCIWRGVFRSDEHWTFQDSNNPLLPSVSLSSMSTALSLLRSLFNIYLAATVLCCSMWNLNSLTGDWTLGPLPWCLGVLATGPPGRSPAVVQWLRLRTPNAWGLCLIPGGRTKIPWVGQPKIKLLVHSDKDTHPEAGKGMSEQRGHGGSPHSRGAYSCRYLYAASCCSVLKTLALLILVIWVQISLLLTEAKTIKWNVVEKLHKGGISLTIWPIMVGLGLCKSGTISHYGPIMWCQNKYTAPRVKGSWP